MAQERKIISWSKDSSGKEFPIYDSPAPPSRYLPENYDGPFTDEMIEEYLRAKGIAPSPPGKTPTGKEYMALADLGLTRLFGGNKSPEKYMDKWFKTVHPEPPPPSVFNTETGVSTPIENVGGGSGPAFSRRVPAVMEPAPPIMQPQPRFGMPQKFQVAQPEHIEQGTAVNADDAEFLKEEARAQAEAAEARRLIPPQKVSYAKPVRQKGIEKPWELGDVGKSVMGPQANLAQKALNVGYSYARGRANPIIINPAKALGILPDEAYPEAEATGDSTADLLGMAAGSVGEIQSLGTMGKLGVGEIPGKIAGAATTKLLNSSDRFKGADAVIKILSHTAEQGGSLATILALSNVNDIKGMPERFGAGFKMGVGFGAAGLINSKSAPIISELVRNFGYRAAGLVTGDWAPPTLENAKQDLFNELLTSFFLRQGTSLAMVLRGLERVGVEAGRTKIGGAPTREQFLEYLKKNPEAAKKLEADPDSPKYKELMSGAAPAKEDISAIDKALRDRVDQEYVTTGSIEAREKQEKDQKEAYRVMGMPGAEPSPVKPKDFGGAEGISSPGVGKNEPRPEGSLSGKTPDYWEEYWESGMGLTPSKGSISWLETKLLKMKGKQQDEINLEKASVFDQRGEAKRRWEKEIFEQIAKSVSEGREIGMDPEELRVLLPMMAKVGKILNATPEFLQPIVSFGLGIKSNADYKKTFDLNTNCPRRFQYAATIDKIQADIGRLLTSNELIGMSQMFKARGDLAPCLYCYVESARRVFNDTVAQKSKELGVDIPANVWNTKESLDAFKAANPKLANTVENIRKKAQASSRANVQKGYSAYTGDAFKISEKDWAEIDSRAGLRMNSNTDFQVDQVLDYMRVVTDLAVLGKKAHAFTKEPAFARIFGKSGVKILQSIYAKAPGMEDAVEGMGWMDAQENREKYENVGTILVAQNDAVLKWGLEQPWIDMVIPYHRSGMTKDQMTYLNLKDYTSKQREKWRKPSEHPLLPGMKKGDNSAKQIHFEDHKNDLKTYLRLCNEAGVWPKFKEFVKFDAYDKKGKPTGNAIDADPGYMKLVTDEPRMEVTQKPVKPEFNWAEITRAIKKWVADGGYVNRKKPNKAVVRAVEKMTGPEGKGEFSFTKPEGPIEMGAGKEPWQMTSVEFSKKHVGHGTGAKNLIDIYRNGLKSGEADDIFTVDPETYGAKMSATPMAFGDRTAIFRKSAVEPGYGGRMYPLKEGSRPIADVPSGKAPHKYLVEQALAEGKSVPPEVLAEYPDLAKTGEPVKPPIGNKEVWAGIGPSSEDVLKADKFLRDRAAKEAEPQPPRPIGINIGTNNKDKVIGYGTTDHAALKASGIEYLGEKGPGQKVVEAYDKSVADINAYEGKPAGEAEVPDPAMLQDRPDLTKRPSHLEEIMPVREILDAVIKIKDTHQGEVETGQRFFERSGGGLVNVLKDVFFEPIQRGGSEINRTVGDLAVELKDKMESEGIKNTRVNTERIGAFMTARQKGGTRVLELSKYEHTKDADGKAVIDITPGEKRVVDWMDQRLLQAYHEINNARVASGQAEIPWAEDYFTFWHLADVINRQGMNLISMPIKEVEAQIKRVKELTENELSQRQAAARSKSRMAKFMFTKRTGLLGPVDLDAFGVFTRYMHSAYEQIYFAEAQSIMKKIVDGRWKIDGKEWTMETGFDGQPETAQKSLKTSLSNYMGFLASGYQGDMNAVLYDVMSKLSRNAAVSKIGLNTKSVLNQLTSNVHSMVDLGPRVWMEGLGDYIAAKTEGGERSQEGKRVGNLSNRSREIALEEFLKKRPRTALGRGYQRVGELSMKPLQFMDMVTAEITWRGAYKSAYRGDLVDKGVKRGNVQSAADYANGEVTRTQGSTQKWDLTPFQRKRYGRIMATLQNFVINEFGFVTRDVMGIRNPQRSPENIKKVMGMMLGAFIVDWVYEQAGMTGPMNILGNVYALGKAGVEASKEKGADVGSVALGVGREFASQVPIVGRGFSSVYGGQTGGNILGPAWDTLSKAPGVFLGKNRKASKMIESAGGLFGIPGAMPFKRAVEAREKGGSAADMVGAFTLGIKPPAKSKSTTSRMSGFSLDKPAPTSSRLSQFDHKPSTKQTSRMEEFK